LFANISDVEGNSSDKITATQIGHKRFKFKVWWYVGMSSRPTICSKSVHCSYIKTLIN